MIEGPPAPVRQSLILAETPPSLAHVGFHELAKQNLWEWVPSDVSCFKVPLSAIGETKAKPLIGDKPTSRPAGMQV